MMRFQKIRLPQTLTLERYNLLKDIYSKQASLAKRGSVQKLFKYARVLVDGLTLNEVRQFLSSQSTYTLHAKRKNKFKTPRVMCRSIDSHWFCDLISLSPHLWPDNDDYRYILSVVDCLSKFAYLRKIKRKTGQNVSEAFEDIFQKSRRTPKKIVTDQGVEFLNKDVQGLLARKNIEHRIAVDVRKSSIVERFNQTILNIINRKITLESSKSFISNLKDIERAYNNSYHQTIKTTPFLARTKSDSTLMKTVYGNTSRKTIRFKFEVGQLCRISRSAKSIGPHAYEGTYSFEIYKILQCIPMDVPTYRIVDLNDNEIIGLFIEPELILVLPPKDHVYEVEKVLEHRTVNGHKMCKVRWAGWPETFDQWVSCAQVKSLNVAGTSS